MAFRLRGGDLWPRGARCRCHHDWARAAGARRTARSHREPADVRFFDPLSLPAVCDAAGRSDVGGGVRPFRDMMTLSEPMDEITKQPMNEQPPPYPPPQAGEGREGAGIRLTAQQLRARRARSIAIALALGVFVVVVFLVTIVRLGSNVLTRPM